MLEMIYLSIWHTTAAGFNL